MKQTRPVLHARDHMAGGADPIPGLLPSTGAAALPSLVGYWPLDDVGPTARDLSVSRHDLSEMDVAPAWRQPGPFADRPDATSVLFNHSSGFVANTDALIDNTAGNVYWFGGVTPYTWEIRVYPTAFETTREAALMSVYIYPDGSSGGMMLSLLPGGIVRMRRAGLSFDSAATVALDTWVHIAMTYDSETLRLYLDGVERLAAVTAAPHAASGSLQLGTYWDGSWRGNLKGRLAEAAIYNEALSPSMIAQHAGTGIVGGAGEGDVLTVDENGNPVWTPPTVEVTGGGINVTPPDETPVDTSSSYSGTPTNPSGWHLDAHFETVILHDSTRGRFDVPTMKWVRVPFNAIRISRTWEPTVGSAIVKTALLPDDRGLSGPARDGILHINSDMVWSSPQTVGGWFSIEYPVLEPGGLPDDDPEVPGNGPRPEAPRPGDPLAAGDTYMRAARMMNVSQGYVLRMAPGSDSRAIYGWGFQDTADGIGDSPFGNLVDNPFPTYPIWAARPMHMLPPYPQMSPTQSRTYYVNYLGDPGFRFDGLQVHTDLAAGANLCLQAWQDAPWLIRFSTDRFPAYHGYTGSYRGYPYLQITFQYDPDTIDHTTGRLLLPAAT